jgi:uroporphyrinogen decarboxylase
MTHRQRLLAALEHRQPDRVPIDFGATRDTSIVVQGYEKLKRHFGVVEENRLSSRMMQVVDVNEAIQCALDVDARAVFPAGPEKGGDVQIAPNQYRDEWGVVRVQPPGALYYDQVSFPLSGQITVHDIVTYPWPDPCDRGRLRGLKQRVREIRENTDCAVVLNLPSAFVHVSQYLRGFEDWYVDLAADRKLAEALYDAVLEVNLAVCDELLREVGDDVDVVMGSDDLGLQKGLMFSEEIYRSLIKPRHRRYFDLLHSRTTAKVFFHTCGSVAAILDDLIEIGVDVLNPVQVSAAGMDPVSLKRRCSGRLAFWGGIDTQRILPHGTVAQVKAEVERMVDVLGEGGGYVLAAVHNIQPDVPLENVLAMFQHARQYRCADSQ